MTATELAALDVPANAELSEARANAERSTTRLEAEMRMDQAQSIALEMGSFNMSLVADNVSGEDLNRSVNSGILSKRNGRRNYGRLSLAAIRRSAFRDDL